MASFLHPTPGTQPQVPGWLVAVLWVLPWIEPWAPGPLPNTLPLLISAACLATLLALTRLPTALELAQAWTWAALISSAIGLLQYFGQAQHLSGWVHVPAGVGEAMGNLRQRNQLATLTGIGAVALLWWHRQGLTRGHAWWMVALLAMGTAATSSRTGLLQWLLLPLLQLLWQHPSRTPRAPWHWPLLLWGVAVYLLASLGLPLALSGGPGHGADISNAIVRMGVHEGCGARSTLWANVLHLIAQKPWIGWGWGELKYAHYMATYPGLRFCEILGNAHNLPLHLAFVWGIPATLALGLAMGIVVLRARPWRLAQAGSSLGWGVLAMVALHSLLEFPLWHGPFQLAVAGAVLVLWPGIRAGWHAHRRALQVLAIGALCLLALVALDYQRVRQIYLPAAQRSTFWQDDPWQAARQTLFFGPLLRFAQFTTMPLTPDNAQTMLDTGLVVLHDSPEPRVIRRVIESARLAGRQDLASWHQAQLQSVYGLPTN